MSELLLQLESSGGIASCDELAVHGVTLRAVDKGVARGDVLRLRRGWVSLPTTPTALQSAVRAGGVISCRSRLNPLGVWVRDDHRLHVRVPRYAKTSPSATGSLIIHRSRPLAGLDAPRGAVDSVSCALAHAILCQHPRDAIATLDSALFTGAVDRETVRCLLAQLPRKYAVYDGLISAEAESGLETHVRLLLRSVGIRARVQFSIENVGRVDLLVGDRLVIETDGRTWHSTAKSFEKDKRRDLALAERGYLVLRLSRTQVLHQSARVVNAVRGIVARDEHRWKARHRRQGLVTL